MAKTITIYDLALLSSYFSQKTEPTEDDKKRMKKIDDAFCSVVDGMTNNQMPLDEILRNILEAMPPKEVA